MKERTKELLAKVEEQHDWIEGQTYSNGGTELERIDICQVCDMKRHYKSDIQNGVEGYYRFLLRGVDISLKAAVEFGCV